MRILFDQGTAVPIRRALRDHTVKTVREQGWSTLLNGDLLRAAEQAGFGSASHDRHEHPYQQNLGSQKLAANKWNLVRSRLQQIVDAVDAAKPGSCTVVG